MRALRRAGGMYAPPALVPESLESSVRRAAPVSAVLIGASLLFALLFDEGSVSEANAEPLLSLPLAAGETERRLRAGGGEREDDSDADDDGLE